MSKPCDVLIIGSGLAGLALALKLPPSLNVTILCKGAFSGANTPMAQGGIAAVHDLSDTFDSHVNDTLVAGAGLCRRDVVEEFVKQAPERIQDLIRWGVQFDEAQCDSSFDLTREGGHSARRILHHADETGAEIHRRLAEKVKAQSHITWLEHQFVIDLIVKDGRCVGAYVLNTSEANEVKAVMAHEICLATGGAGKVYLYTSNWSGASGDGIALAYRAGASVANLEFMQFHPTCLYHPEARNFLISEALRGEGGHLINRDGHRFMLAHHPLAELAPRDIVARSIDAEMKKTGAPCVYLDMTHLEKSFLQQRFPGINKKCLDHGIDMAQNPIPVVPAAHYLCGGIVTRANGATEIPGLFAIGETACTGFHGANRLASNSLLECLTMSHLAAEEISKNCSLPRYHSRPQEWSRQNQPDAEELVIVSHSWEEIRRLMWNYVGIVRSNRRLESARCRLENILKEISNYEIQFKAHPEILELRNLALVASLTVECASLRKESRGIHFSLDFPFTGIEAKDSLIESPFKHRRQNRRREDETQSQNL